MKSWITKGIGAILIAIMLCQPTFACNTTPKANTRTCAPQKDKQFVIDNFKIISEALEKLGVTPDELQKMIKEGKNLSEVLKAKDISDHKFKKVLLKTYYKVIYEGVKEDKITKEQGKMLKKAIKEKVSSWSSK